MKVTVELSTTVKDLSDRLGRQLKNAAAQQPGSWPALAAVRDHVAAGVAGQAPDAKVDVKVSLEVSYQVTTAETKPSPAPAAAAT